MDTLSRDSSSSSNIAPIAGIFAGVIALILSIAALVQISGVKKTVAAQADSIAKIGDLENQVRATASKSDTEMKSLREGIQNALNQVGTEIGSLRDSVKKIEEAAKRPASAPGKGGAAAAPTGVMNPDGTYTVAAGDNLSKIAKKFGVRVDAIEAENPGLDPTHLRVGQKIRMPKK